MPVTATPGSRVFRALSATIVMVGSAAIALFLLGDAVVRAGIVTGMLLAPWVLLVLWGVYVLAYVSCVQTDASGIRVQNLLRIIEVPWAQVDDIAMRWQLELHLRDGAVVRCFGGPGGGRPGRLPRRSDTPGRPADPPAVRDIELIRDQWHRAVDTDAPASPVQRFWDVWALVALGVLVTWAVIAVLTTGGP